MSKPITITVPDSLHGRLQKYKEKLNVSQVCQKALDEKIRDWERKTEAIQGDPDMGEILSRLRKEKAEVEQQWYQKGLKAGLFIAKRASYEELKVMATKVKTIHEQREGEVYRRDDLSAREKEVLNDSWEEYLEEFGYFDNDQGEDFYPPDFILQQNKPEKLSYWSSSSSDSGEIYIVATEDFYVWEDGFFESIRRFWDEVKGKI